MRDISKKYKCKDVEKLRKQTKRFFLRLNKEWVGWKAFKNKFQQERKSNDLFQSQKVYSKMRSLKEINTVFCYGGQADEYTDHMDFSLFSWFPLYESTGVA